IDIVKDWPPFCSESKFRPRSPLHAGVIFEVLLSRPRFLGHENRDRIINIRQGVTLAKSCVSVKEFWFWHFTVKL
ncbi:unnamed protein product, partial [Porites evermanni]